MVADFLNLGSQIEKLESENIDFYHIDIMDGRFVDNFALSIDFIKVIRPLTRKTIDVHLMVEKPERYIDAVIAAGANIVTIHAEATLNLHGALSSIRNKNVKAGVALNPSTAVQSLEYVADLIDVLLIMTVNPGFAGQQFIEGMYDKVAFSKNWLKTKNASARIEVDGNISPLTLPGCINAGAEMFVLGTSSLFKPGGEIEKNLRYIRNIMMA